MSHIEMFEFSQMNLKKNRHKTFAHFYDDFTSEERKEIFECVISNIININLNNINKLPFIQMRKIYKALCYGPSNKNLRIKTNELLMWK